MVRLATVLMLYMMPESLVLSPSIMYVVPYWLSLALMARSSYWSLVTFRNVPPPWEEPALFPYIRASYTEGFVMLWLPLNLVFEPYMMYVEPLGE